MPKIITILLICCLVFLSGPASLVQAVSRQAPLADGCTDPQNCQKTFVPMVGKNSTFRAGDGVKACLMADGPVDDYSFNAMTWQGVQGARSLLGTQAVLQESVQQADYAAVIDSFIAQKCDLVLTVGFMAMEATKTAAEANPDQKFAIVDASYDPPIANVRGMVFAVDQPAFLAGYLAAGMSQTGKVGVFGGMQFPTVTIFMDGFYYGVQYYNQQKGKTVEVLGWDPVKQEGLFAGSFSDQEMGNSLGNTLMDEGADVILPVAGPVGLGTAQAVQAHGSAWLVGVDSDWTVTTPQYSSIILTSVMKLTGAPAFQAIKDVVYGQFTGGNYTGTLANGGVGLGATASAVPPALLSEVEQIKAGIISGALPKQACLVTDTAGIDDHSFNAMTWKGLTDAQTALGTRAFYLESTQQTDYAPAINQFISQGCDLILTTGFLLGDATYNAAQANPGQKFAISDFNYDPALPNVRGIVFEMDESAFLAGYLAAGRTQTGKVAVYGGLQIPPVTLFMDGFYYGVQYYNQQKQAAVQVIGWDPAAQTGLFAGNFEDFEVGKTMGNFLLSQGADIIFPIAGPTSLGTADAVQTHGSAWIIGPDTDWTVTNPQYSSIVLTSVIKRLDVTAYNAVRDMAYNQFTGGAYMGTLANGGTGLGTTTAPAPVLTELEQIKAGIIAGTIPVHP